MKQTLSFHSPIIASTQSKVAVEAFEKSTDAFEKGERLQSFYLLLDYIDPELRSKFGNAEGTEFAVPHGSIMVYLRLEGDLEYNIALNLAKGGMVKAISAQMPYEQGEAVATVAVKTLLDEVVPSYIGVEPVYVDRYNLQKVWQKSYKEPLPEEIKQALNWTCLNEI